MQKRVRTRACAGYDVAPACRLPPMTSAVLRAWDRPTRIFCQPIMIAPRTETGIRPHRPPLPHHRDPVGTHTITATDRLPDGLHHAKPVGVLEW